jgi:hypothetical protein
MAAHGSTSPRLPKLANKNFIGGTELGRRPNFLPWAANVAHGGKERHMLRRQQHRALAVEGHAPGLEAPERLGKLGDRAGGIGRIEQHEVRYSFKS